MNNLFFNPKSFPTSRFALRAGFAVFVILLGFSIPAVAQNLPAGAILQVDNGTTPVSQPYETPNVFQNYSVTFTDAASGSNYVLFAFRQVPAYWTFGNVSLTAEGSEVNLFDDPTFTQGGAVSTQSNLTAPADWGIVYQSTTTPGAAGHYAPPGSSYANAEPGVNEGTAGSWYDGAVESYDGIYQGVDLTAGTEYTISFALSGNDAAVSPTIEVGVFTGACESLSSPPTDCVPANSGFDVDFTPGQTQNAGGASDINTNDPADPAAGLAANPATLLPVFDGGTLLLDGTALTPYTFSITGNNGTVDLAGLSATISNPISNAVAATPGSLSIINSGTGGALTLTGANTYTGATSIAAGATLALAGTGSISTSSDVTVNGIFDISGLTDAGTGITSLDGAGTVALGANNLVLTSAAGTFGGAIAGAGQLDLNGGTETMNGVSTYTGGTYVNAGTLVIGDASHSGAAIAGPATILQGATLAGYGTVGGSVTNAGTLIPGASGAAPAVFNVGGNYSQSATGNLLIAVTPASSSVLHVNGNVSLAGQVTFAFAPGSYAAHTYPFVTTPGTISGTFSSVAETGDTPTQLPLSLAYDNTAAVDPVELVLGGVVAPADDGIFSAQNQELAAAAQETTSSLLDEAMPPAGASAGCAGEQAAAKDASSSTTQRSAEIAQALASAFCSAGGWLNVSGTFTDLSRAGIGQSYRANTAAVLGGIDRPVGPSGLRVGLAIGYDEAWLRDSDSGSASADTTSFSLYGAQPVGRLLLSGAVSYAHAWETTGRQTGVGGASESHEGNIFSGGLQASTDFPVMSYDLIPQAGLRISSVASGSFYEVAPTGYHAFAVHGARSGYASVQPYAQVAVTRSFVTANKITISPEILAGYEAEAGDRSRPVYLTANGTGFTSSAAAMDANDAILSACVSATFRNWSLFADYTAHVAGNWTTQIGQAGLSYTF
jgi:autotransporter-associated beta strand protein